MTKYMRAGRVKLVLRVTFTCPQVDDWRNKDIFPSVVGLARVPAERLREGGEVAEDKGIKGVLPCGPTCTKVSPRIDNCKRWETMKSQPRIHCKGCSTLLQIRNSPHTNTDYQGKQTGQPLNQRKAKAAQ